MIHVEGLGKQFRGQWLFRDVSFEVEKGHSISIVGPSGSGKTVLLKLLAGLLEPTEGLIQIPRVRLSKLFQKNALFDSFTVLENLLFPLKERLNIEGPEAKRRASTLLKQVGLDHVPNLRPNEISGGMQKRLGIARALVVEPEILLYDEPTAGLDPITSKIIADLILELRGDTGQTLVTVTTDMHRAYQLGYHIYLLAQGRLIGGESPEKTKQTQDPAMRQFIYGLLQGPLTPQGAWK